MRYLKDRKDIASFIHTYPTILFDVSKRDDYGFKGTKVRIDYHAKDGRFLPIRADIRVYKDTGCVEICGRAVCLSDSFGYSDLIEMAEFENAPLIKPDSNIVLVVYDSILGQAWSPVVLATGPRVEANCQTPLTLESLDVYTLTGYQR